MTWASLRCPFFCEESLPSACVTYSWFFADSPTKNTASKQGIEDGCRGAVKTPALGNPDEKHISTSFVERQNLTMRMAMRRFTRLTNGFSKKVENHACAIGLHYMYYNFGRMHKTPRVTPAMEAKVSDHVWSLEEIATPAD
jgi:hypothetical protein